MIGPLREEIVSLIPSMKLYHNVLYDDEIKKIKKLANPKVKYWRIVGTCRYLLSTVLVGTIGTCYQLPRYKIVLKNTIRGLCISYT